MSSDHEYDFAVIGGGSAGYAAARTAAGLGLRTVVIDGAEELGGLCILRGCMPSKTLIESANRALSAGRGAEFGVSTSFRGADIRAIRDRKRALIADFASYRQGQLADGRFTLIRGTARFEEAQRLRVTPREEGEAEMVVEFKTALIATGSHIAVPELPGLKDAGYWTSDSVLDAAEIPESIVVLGGGAIALEMAHYLAGIGRAVTVIQRGPHLLSSMDADVGDVVRAAFEKRGITVYCGTKLLRVEATPAGKRVLFEHDGSEVEVEAAEILLALGRRPNLASLDLEAAGIGTDRDRLTIANTQQTSQPHVFAAGDVCGPHEVVHLAIQQGELAARNAAALLRGEGPAEEMDYRLALFGVFTHPQAAQVGLTERQAEETGRRVIAASYPFDDHGKSMVMGETEGFVKIIGDPETGEILGASVVGPEAVELIHQPAVAMHFRSTAEEFLKIPFYHPTLSEIWSYPAEEIVDAMEG